MYLSELVKKNEKDLKKLSKAEIIESITKYNYQYSSLETSKKDLEKKLKDQKVNEDAAKHMLVAYTGHELEKPEYGQASVDTVNLLFLIGLAMEKAARYE